MLAAGGRWCRHSFNIACHHTQPPPGARGFNIHAIIQRKKLELEKGKNTGDLHNTGNDKADGDAGSHVEKNSGGGVPTDPPSGSYSTVDINQANKTVTTTVGELPISPLMDPSFHDARTRYTKPKPKNSGHKLTKWQRRMRRNPYALALATPVRRSPACSTAIPRFFLERFNLLAHPETGDPWIVPTGLNSKVSKGAAPKPADPGEAAWETALEEASGEEDDAVGEERALEEDGDVGEELAMADEEALDEEAALEDDLAVDKETPEKEETPLSEEVVSTDGSVLDEKTTLVEEPAKQVSTHPSGTPRGVKTGATSYVLSRQTLFREFNNPNSEYFKREKKLFRMSDHGLARLSQALNKAVWRSDMDAVLLELMRRRVVEGLCYFGGLVQEQGRGYVTECKQWDDVTALKHKGCLLYLGPPPTEAGEASSGEHYVPPRLSTMDIEGDRYTNAIAVHNLPEILGEEHLARLREGCGAMRNGSLYHLGRLATVDLQMMIWRLQGYMAWDEPKADEPKAEEADDAPPES